MSSRTVTATTRWPRTTSPPTPWSSVTRTGPRHGVYCLSIFIGQVIPAVHTVTIDEVQEVYDNYNQYVSGKMKSSTTGYGIQALPELDLRFVTTKWMVKSNLLSNPLKMLVEKPCDREIQFKYLFSPVSKFRTLVWRPHCPGCSAGTRGAPTAWPSPGTSSPRSGAPLPSPRRCAWLTEQTSGILADVNNKGYTRLLSF